MAVGFLTAQWLYLWAQQTEDAGLTAPAAIPQVGRTINSRRGLHWDLRSLSAVLPAAVSLHEGMVLTSGLCACQLLECAPLLKCGSSMQAQAIAKASGGLYDTLMRVAPEQNGRPKEVLIAISNYNLWPMGALPLWIKVLLCSEHTCQSRSTLSRMQSLSYQMCHPSLSISSAGLTSLTCPRAVHFSALLCWREVCRVGLGMHQTAEGHFVTPS